MSPPDETQTLPLFYLEGLLFPDSGFEHRSGVEEPLEGVGKKRRWQFGAGESRRTWKLRTLKGEMKQR